MSLNVQFQKNNIGVAQMRCTCYVKPGFQVSQSCLSPGLVGMAMLTVIIIEEKCFPGTDITLSGNLVED